MLGFILISTLVLGLLGFIFAGLLGLAADYFKVDEDPKVAAILALLPGANCGACGAAGCHDYAVKVARGEISVGSCTVGGEKIAKEIAAIMGVEGHEVHKKVAAVHCGAKKDQRKTKSNYHGVKTCKYADTIDGGGLMCGYGCLGYGDCFDVCQFDAIKMVDGLPVIDPEKCTACNKCVEACPRSIISLRPFALPIVIACSSRDKGAITRKTCPVGCIACKICEKEAPEVFKVEDNLAKVDYSKPCSNCDSAITKCPTKCIIKI